MNRITRLLIVIILSILVCVSGCKKKDTINNLENDDNNDFFYCVLDEASTSDNMLKIYLGNNLLYELPKSTLVSYHFNHKIILKENKIYAIVKNDSIDNVVSIWKNGHKLYSIIATQAISPGCLCLDGNNIITTVHIQDKCEIWKNNELLYTLEAPDSTRRILSYMAMTVSNDVYVSGLCTGIYNNVFCRRATIWKNKNIIFSSEGGSYDRMVGIGYDNGNIYYYGNEESIGDPGGPHGKIWKNSNVICDAAEKDWAYYGEINDIVIYNDDVYAAGYIEIEPYHVSDHGNKGRVGVVWKNGDILYEIADQLPSGNYVSDNSYVELFSINIINGDVFVSGKVCGMSSGDFIAKIWKNGVEYMDINEDIYGPGKTVYLLKNGINYEDQF